MELKRRVRKMRAGLVLKTQEPEEA
jgi:hypothetical protein